MMILELKDLWKYYCKGMWVLKGINFDIKESEIVALLGHNGAGKTTIMKCIMNLIFPQRGTIKIFGIENKNAECKKNISFLPEKAFLPPYYKLKELVKIVCELRGLKWDKMKNKVYNLLEYFELTDYSDKFIGSFSKGTLQKAALLVSILPTSKLYLWDEPSQNLDPVIRKKLIDFIKNTIVNGHSFLISSHSLTEIERIATRLIIIKQGTLIIDENINNILKSGKTLEELYLEVHK